MYFRGATWECCVAVTVVVRDGVVVMGGSGKGGGIKASDALVLRLSS